MKTWRLIFLLVLPLLCFTVKSLGGEKDKLKWMGFNEGIAEAQKTGKKVMIDVYTDWCGWCKKMDRDTYAEETVAGYLNKKYVSIKLNAESSAQLRYRGESYTERELASAFGVSGYPAIIFLGNDGDPITVYPGYADATKFKKVLTYIAEDHYKTTQFQDFMESKN